MKLEIDELSTFTHKKLIELLVTMCAENAELRKQLEDLQRKSTRSANRFSKDNPKKNPKKPGRKGRKKGDRGDFKQREAPEEKLGDEVQDIQAPLENDHNGVCPKCGGSLDTKTDLATTIDIPETIIRNIKRYHVEVCECSLCGYRERGMHPDLPSDQHGATAHRVGPRITALGLSLHYHYGVTMRKVPAILNGVHDIKLGQSALTQVALKLGTEGGAIHAKRSGLKRLFSNPTMCIPMTRGGGPAENGATLWDLEAW